MALIKGITDKQPTGQTWITFLRNSRKIVQIIINGNSYFDKVFKKLY